MSTFRMADLVPLITAKAQEMGVDPKIALGIFTAENSDDGKLSPDKMVALNTQGIDPETGKPSGALGLFQVVGSTYASLKEQGKIPADTNYGTLEGQLTTGIAAVKDALMATGGDPMAAAALYVNGQKGLKGYLGKGEMPAQTAGYLPKFARATGMTWNSKVIPAAQKTELDKDVAAFNTASDVNIPMLQAMGVDANKASNDLSAAVTAGGTAAIDVKNAAAARQVDEVNTADRLRGIFGNQDDELIAGMTKFASENAKAEAQKPVIDELMSINPLANPVKWLVAQMQLTPLVTQHNAAIQNRDMAANEIAVRQQMAAHQKTLTPAVQLATIEQERQANVQLQAATTAANLAKIDAENIQGRVKFLSEEMNWRAQNVNQSLAVARLNAESVGLRKDESIKVADQGIMDRGNLRRIALGGPRVATMAELKLLPPDQQQMFINAPSEAQTPANSIKYILGMDSLTSLQRNPETTAMGDMVVEIGNKVKPQVQELQMKNPGMKYMDALTTAINGQIKTWRDEVAGGDMTRATPGNPYRMNALQFASAPMLKDNLFAQFVQGEGRAMPNVGEKELLAYAIGQVRAGTKTADQVSEELATFMQRGSEHQWKTRGMGTLGFDSRTYKPPGSTVLQNSYAVSRNIFGWFDRIFNQMPASDRDIEMLNATDIKHFLVQATVKSIQDPSAQRQQRSNDENAAARFGVPQ